MVSPRRILLTGASSFFGRILLPTLLQAGHEVFATTRRAPKGAMAQSADEAERLHLLRLNITDRSAFAALPREIDTVVHAAAVSSDGQVPVADLAASNVTGTHNVIEYAVAAGAANFIFISSILVHGLVQSGELTRDTAIQNPGAYGMSKRMGEWMLDERAAEIASVSLRVPGILGPGATRHWLATVLERARRGEDIEIYNPEGLFNNAVDARSLSAFIAALADRDMTGAAVVPLGSAGAITIETAARILAESAGRGSRVLAQPAPRPAYLINNDQAFAMGYHPRNIEDAVRDFAQI